MNLKDILQLIDKVADRGIAGVEIEQAGTKVRIEGKTSQPQVIHSFVSSDARSEAPLMSAIPLHALPPAPAAPAEVAARPAAQPSNLHVMSSPIVGTYYGAPSPDADPFVKTGDRVRKGQVLCIIEAMKLMNEIESDVDGVVKEIYPQNAQAVEFGEPLFGIEV